MTKIALTLSGSSRDGSINSRLARLMGTKLRDRGAEVTDLSLSDFPMPLFNEDVESNEGDPRGAIELAHLLAAADAVFISTPEYNNSIPPLMKNTIDWVSRQKTGPFKRATFGLGAVSDGRLSGAVALSHLRDIFGKMGVLMAPTSLSVAFGKEGFTEDGALLDPVQASRADQLADQLMTITRNPQ